MKNLLLTILLFTGIFHDSFAQSNYPTWPQPGATWNICSYYPIGSPQLQDLPLDLSYTKDTIINTTTYSIIDYPASYRPYRILTRFSNDTIFRLVNGTEYLFFTYNVSLGDTLSLLRTGVYDYDQDTCGNTLELWHNQVSLVTYNNQIYKCWHFQELDNGNPELSEREYYWLENVGWFNGNGSPWPVPNDIPWITNNYQINCSDGEDGLHIEYYYVSDYFDNNTSIQIRDCNDNSSVKEENDYSFQVFPNPVQNKITINCSIKEGVLKLTSLQGKNLRQLKLNSQQEKYMLDVEDLASGLYLITLENSVGEVMLTKKVMKE